jgi:amidase
MEITDLNADDLSRAIHAKDVSCVEVMSAYLERIWTLNPKYNAIVSLQDEDLLLWQARELDERLANGVDMGWLHGLPQAIKDLAATAGIRTTNGSPLNKDNVPAADNLMVSRMKAAGCIVIGKTNAPEFGLGSHTFNEVFGHTHNAYDLSKTSGGSSGGAAVSLATRMLPVADGSDFMGSLRNPAGWNNVFGFRPSQGRVPNAPAADAYVSQLGTEGPMGRTVKDVAMLLDVQAGYDARAPLSLNDGARFNGRLDGLDAKTMRIGWLGDLNGYLAMEPGVLDVCSGALGRLEGAGCTVEPASFDYPPEDAWDAWLVWRRWLVASRIAPYLKNPENRDLIKPEALWEYDEARSLTGADVLDASQQRTEFFQSMLRLFERFDYLALPSAQVFPFDGSLRWPSSIAGRTMDTYHRWMEVTIYATFAGLPAVCVPAGFSADGLPMGLQLIGRPRGDWDTLRVAALYEALAQDVIGVRPPGI